MNVIFVITNFILNFSPTSLLYIPKWLEKLLTRDGVIVIGNSKFTVIVIDRKKIKVIVIDWKLIDNSILLFYHTLFF